MKKKITIEVECCEIPGCEAAGDSESAWASKKLCLVHRNGWIGSPEHRDAIRHYDAQFTAYLSRSAQEIAKPAAAAVEA